MKVIDRESAERTALRLLEQEGLDGLSLGRVARQLNVRVPTLYVHFSSRRALLERVTDLILVPAGPQLEAAVEPGEGWRPWLIRTAQLLRRALLAHRDGARVALAADPRRALGLGAFFERTVVVLHGAGFGLVDAARAARGFMSFVLGRTAEEQATAELTRMAAAAGSGGASAMRLHPAITRFVAKAERRAAGQDPDEVFRRAVTAMVDTLRTTEPSGVPG